MWSLDSGDTRGLDATEITEHVLTEASPGAIVLLHDGGDLRTQTLQAVAALLPALRERGFELVTISDLLGQP
jgi:peptidoglycan/xylan/chitin deacetylase (PgdA/CDA1 family)